MYRVFVVSFQVHVGSENKTPRANSSLVIYFAPVIGRDLCNTRTESSDTSSPDISH
jgi:hypothetical protein